MAKRQSVATCLRNLNCLWWDFSSLCMTCRHLGGQFWLPGVTTIKHRMPPFTSHFHLLFPSLSVSHCLSSFLSSTSPTGYEALLLRYSVLTTVHQMWPSHFKFFNSPTCLWVLLISREQMTVCSLNSLVMDSWQSRSYQETFIEYEWWWPPLADSSNQY